MTNKKNLKPVSSTPFPVLPRILMIISLFKPIVGGTEKQAEQLAKRLREKGVKIFFLTRKLKGSPELEIIENIPVYRKIKTIEFGFFWGISYLFSTLLFLIQNRKEYDLIHCHHLQGFHSLAAILIKRLFNKKVIIKVAGGGSLGDIAAIKKRKLGRIYLWFLRKADRVISVSNEITCQLKEHGFSLSQIAEIPNGVDLQKFRVQDRSLPSEKRLLIYIGRFDHGKGLEDLLSAFKKVHESQPGTQLLLVGDGGEKEKLLRLAYELKIHTSIHFEGVHDDVNHYLGKSEIFVFPSLSEGMSNVLLEAMACGLPIVATRIGGNLELIENGLNGLLVSPGNPGELAEAILWLLTNPDRAKEMGKRGREKVEANYSLDLVVEKYLNLYRQIYEN